MIVQHLNLKHHITFGKKNFIVIIKKCVFQFAFEAS